MFGKGRAKEDAKQKKKGTGAALMQQVNIINLM